MELKRHEREWLEELAFRARNDLNSAYYIVHKIRLSGVSYDEVSTEDKASRLLDVQKHIENAIGDLSDILDMCFELYKLDEVKDTEI